MEKGEAKELLSFHSMRNENIDDTRWENGFLGSLRPFCGELREENFVQVMECLGVLREEFSAPAIDREMTADIVAIIHLTRAWMAPGGMLGSNHLLTEEQTERLQAWVDIIETCFMYLLDNDVEDAFDDYEAYMRDEYI